MSYSDIIAISGRWEGYRVAGTRTVGSGDHKRIEVELVPQPQERMFCAACGGPCTSVHETTKRVVRDLPILDAQTYLIVHRRRLLCPRGGPVLERLSWLAKYARVTRRLADSVARLCGVLAVKHVAEYLGLSWDQVKEIDKRSLKERVGTVDLSKVEVIGMDEFALHKGPPQPSAETVAAFAPPTGEIDLSLPPASSRAVLLAAADSSQAMASDKATEHKSESRSSHSWDNFVDVHFGGYRWVWWAGAAVILIAIHVAAVD